MKIDLLPLGDNRVRRVTTTQGLKADLYTLSVREFEAIQLAAANLPTKEQDSAIKHATLRASVRSLSELEIGGVFEASIDAVLDKLDRLPGNFGRALDELFLLAIGGPSVTPDPSAPRSA